VELLRHVPVSVALLAGSQAAECSEDEGGWVDGVACWLWNTSDPVERNRIKSSSRHHHLFLSTHHSDNGKSGGGGDSSSQGLE